MSKDFSRIKAALSSSTTLPNNTGQAHFSIPSDDELEDECEHDHTSPKGGCGCC